MNELINLFGISRSPAEDRLLMNVMVISIGGSTAGRGTRGLSLIPSYYQEVERYLFAFQTTLNEKLDPPLIWYSTDRVMQTSKLKLDSNDYMNRYKSKN